MCGRNWNNLLLLHLVGSILENPSSQPQPVVATRPADCPRCKAAISPNFKWCPKCGYELETRAACAYCGNKVEIGVRFCPSCGAPSPKTG